MPHVDVLVSNDFLPDLPDALGIMDASEVSRTSEDRERMRVTIEMAYVPDGARIVEPIFVNTPDGVRVQSLSWTYAD